MTTRIDRYNVDEYRLLIKPGGSITLDTGNTGQVAILGNLVVYGQTTTISSTDLDITDNILILNKGEQNSGVSLITAGISVDRGLLPNAELLFDESKNWLDSQTYSTVAGAFKFTTANGNSIGIITNKGRDMPRGQVSRLCVDADECCPQKDADDCGAL